MQGAHAAELLKYKRFDNEEFEIVSATTARGTNARGLV